MTLDRPIVFFDLETTGTNVTSDRIVEISIIKVYHDGREPKEFVQRINPGIPIPAEATAVHHITDDDVKNAPKFETLAQKIADTFRGADIAGFNSTKFDIPLLCEEMARAKVAFDVRSSNLVDVQTIYHKKEPRNLSAAYRFYCGKELEGAHSAIADTRATYEVFKAQLEKYEDLPKTIEEIAEFSSYGNNVDLMGRFVRDENKRILVNFGKYKGKPLIQVLKQDPSYYDWIISSDFPIDTKQVITSVYLSLNKK